MPRRVREPFPWRLVLVGIACLVLFVLFVLPGGW